MRLISLNIWGGHVRDPLLTFIKSHQKTDIFCLQEVYHNAPSKISDEDRFVSLNIFSEIQALLPHHRGFFKPVVKNIFGIGMFIRKSIDVLGEGEVSIHHNPLYRGSGPTHSRNLQWAKYRIKNQTQTIINVHGLWNGLGKTDAPERILQSERIRHFMNSVKTPMILSGDFNLRPDTQSIKMIAQGMTNLVELYDIRSTRTSLYPKEEKFADYIFTSPELTIHHFEVMKDEVSDHAPLLLDFT